MEYLRSAKQEICYTFKGESLEKYEPFDTLQGFQYVKIVDLHQWYQ
jgi:hypothetical protein